MTGVPDILIGLAISFAGRSPVAGCGISITISRACTCGSSKTSLNALIGPQPILLFSRFAIHQAVGFGLANSILVEGDACVFVVDVMGSVESARAAVAVP